MSKKLLIAVLTLGFLLTLSGAAFTSDTPKQVSETGVVEKINPDAARFNDITAVPRHIPSFQKPATGIQELPEPTSILPPQYYCTFQDYSGGLAYYFWTIPDPYGDDYFNMRHTVVEEGYECTLAVAYIGVYPSAFVGTPDMDVVVWDDDGFGYPLNELGRVNVPYSALPTGMAYAAVDMRSLNLTFLEGDEFHVGVTTTDQVNNVLAILSDDGSNGMLRSSENWAGFWGLMIDDWGIDVNFLMGVDLCCADLPYSECYVQDYNCGAYYYWTQPDPYGDDYFNMRMSVEGPETLAAVDIATYRNYPEAVPGDLDVFVWGSSGGFPDLTDVIWSTTIPYASLVWFGATNVFPVSPGIVMRSDFHVGWSTNDASGGNLACLSDDGSCGTLRSSEYWSGFWGTMLGDWGVDVNFLISAHMCKDEFAVCHTQNYTCNLQWFWRLPDVYGDIGDYQLFHPSGIGCRAEKARIAFYWSSSEAGLPLYTHNSEFQLWDNDGGFGLPGSKLAGIVVTPADYVLYPGWTEVDFTPMNITFDDDIWMGVESFAPNPDEGIRTLSDDGTCGTLASCENWAGSFYYMLDDWGVDINFLMELDKCCIPIDERNCDVKAGEDWVTAAHDFRRTAASFNSTGDAKCLQALSWMDNNPEGYIYSRIIIYDGILVSASNTQLRGYDLAGGGLLWTIAGLPEIGAGLRNSVTAKDGWVYYGGGNGRSFSRADVYTGNIAAPGAWSRNVINNPFVGNTVYTTSVILDCDGTEVVFLTTATGELYALEAATGINYAGWGVNPIQLGGDPTHTLSSNGVDVVYVGDDGGLGNGNGTMYAIDACTGVILWTLGEGQLEGPALSGLANPGEIFQGPLAVDDNGDIYAITGFNNSAGPPSGGRYRIDAGGNIVWAAAGRFPRFTGPVLDASLVTFTELRFWSSESEQTESNKKASGSPGWTSDAAFNSMNWNEGALSCEDGVRDILYLANMDGQFLAINNDDGSVEFDYNYIHGSGSANRGCGTAINATHVCFNNRQGDIYCFTNQVERPRLRILRWDEMISVPFFSPPSFIVTYDDVFMNNGCANLTGTLTADETPPAASAWSVDPARINRMQKAADGMLDNSFADMARNLVKGQRVGAEVLDAEYMSSPYAKDSYSNMGAYAPPAWLNGIVVSQFNLAPGEAFDVILDVNGPLVTRGPHRCYISINSNDDYYLNDTKEELPAPQLGVLGGCLEADDSLLFGLTSQNVAPVMNTGEVVDNGESAGHLFDGTGSYFLGALFIGGPTENDLAPPWRLAWSSDSWSTADPNNMWLSLLPDVNCFGVCEPYVTPNPIVLGRINDGAKGYIDVMGYSSHARYIDSVINFDCDGTGWDWGNIHCDFDNSLTMGLTFDEHMYGVIGVAELNNVIIYRDIITNRNPTTAEGVMFGAIHDWDLEDYECDLVAGFDAEHGVGWCYSSTAADPTNTIVAGSGSIPFSTTPLLGIHTMDARQAMWDAAYPNLDSAYYYAQNYTEATYQTGTYPGDECATDDREFWHTYWTRDFAGNETFDFGWYLFSFNDADAELRGTYSDLAKLVNQFCGFDRGDMDGDGNVGLNDAVAIVNLVNGDPGPTPLFEHLADVDNSGGAPNLADAQYLSDYHFCQGPAPVGGWVLPNICP
jgi:hypothetical protein